MMKYGILYNGEKLFSKMATHFKGNGSYGACVTCEYSLLA